jgi:hypothetical protein
MKQRRMILIGRRGHTPEFAPGFFILSGSIIREWD